MGSRLSGLSSERAEVAPGAVWLRGYLSLDEQVTLVQECRALMDGPAGGYVPRVRGGGKMHVRMVCLGRHWNARTYKYEATRADHDGAPVTPMPESLAALASRIAADAGVPYDAAGRPDVAIINFYDAEGKMGVHQDKDESPESIAAGEPVVSLSIGDTARFLMGGFKRKEPVEPILLESGDAFVFGGASRLRYHGVSRILPGTAPAALGLSGRFNLTFRKY